MKAVLLSIRSEWCSRIFSGCKTVEIRKTRPVSLKEPFKCYIYCTKGTKFFCWKAVDHMLNFIPAPIAIALMLLGFVALAVGGIRLGYKATVKDLALELVEKAELSIMGSGQGAKKKKQVFAALRAKCPAAIRWAITDEVLDTVIEHAFDVMTAALGKKS